MDESLIDDYDLVVVGCGIAGTCAGTRAAQLGNSVVILEKSPKDRRGGQTRLTGGLRFPFTETDLSGYDIRIASDREMTYTDEIPEETDFIEYSPEDFYHDIMKATNNQADSDLVQTLVWNVGETIEWMTSVGVEWEEITVAKHSEYTTIRHKHHEGKETVTQLLEIAEAFGADVRYETGARELHLDTHSRIAGVSAIQKDKPVHFECDAVIIAAGGFDSNPEKRTKYLGPRYGNIPIRGSRYNTGEAFDMALDIGAMPAGDWGTGHITLVDPAVNTDSDGFLDIDTQRAGIKIVGYTFGVLVNHDGERFVDEGMDSRDGTYALFGRKVFEQPYHEAFSIVDSTMKERTWWGSQGPTEPIRADSIRELARRLGIGDVDSTVETIEAFNESCDSGEFVFPLSEDDNSTTGITPPKSHWAFPIENPPFYGLPATGGITFVPFGGLKINSDAQVIDTRHTPIPGLYAAGNSTGGVVAHNYKARTGQAAGATFGKRAAEHATDYIASSGQSR